jgi:hypothetical protein
LASKIGAADILDVLLLAKQGLHLIDGV